MSIFNVLNAGIYSKLTGGTALTGLLASVTSVYYQAAPDNASTPFVVWSYQGGGPENVNPSDMRDELVFVRGWADSPALAGSVDAQISTLLHKQTLTVSGYTNYWTVREQDLSSYEVIPNKQKRHMAGAIYRIQLDD